MALITFETVLLREKEQITVEVEYGAYSDEFFLNSVRPVSIMGEDEVEHPCDNREELITTKEEDQQLKEEAQAHWEKYVHEGRHQREIWQSQEEDYKAWRRS